MQSEQQPNDTRLTLCSSSPGLSEVPRLVKVYESWIALQPPFKLFPWPQSEEEEAAYAEEIRSEYPHSRLIMEHARGCYLDVTEKDKWQLEDETY